MKIKFNEKYNTIVFYVIVTFTLCVLIATVILNHQKLFEIISSILTVLSPIIWGLVIAYLLNPVVKFSERYLSKFLEKKKPRKKLVRALSISVATILTLAVIATLIASVVPEIIDNLKNIFVSIPTYMNNLQDFIQQYLSKNPEISKTLFGEFEDFKTYLVNLASQLQPKFDEFVLNLRDGAFSFLTGLKDFILGFIVSIYLLFSREIFIAQSKKFIYALFPNKLSDNILSISKQANETFISFLTGKALDSLIIGLICFIVMTILKMPYIVLISFIIGITNMIPFFGPFIGAIPSAILVLVSQPEQVIWFILFVFLLQQFDGNFLGPKILGNSLGLPAFWIMFSIFLGGGLFGFAGMLTAVPIFAVIYTLTKTFVDDRLKAKNMPVGSENYREENIHKLKKIIKEDEDEEITNIDDI